MPNLRLAMVAARSSGHGGLEPTTTSAFSSAACARFASHGMPIDNANGRRGSGSWPNHFMTRSLIRRFHDGFPVYIGSNWSPVRIEGRSLPSLFNSMTSTPTGSFSVKAPSEEVLRVVMTVTK